MYAQEKKEKMLYRMSATGYLPLNLENGFNDPLSIHQSTTWQITSHETTE
jgi:hypothetical protein